MEPNLYKFTKVLPKAYDKVLREAVWAEDESELYDLCYHYHNKDSERDVQMAAERLYDLMMDVASVRQLDMSLNVVEILEEVREDLRKEYPQDGS